MSKTKILFFLLICFVLTNSAFAWDDTGHKLTTYIAWQRMSPEVRERAIKILLSSPEDSDLSVFFMQDSRSDAARRLEFFMISSVWSDIIRNRDFKVRFRKYHHGTWHYLDTFWRDVDGKVEIISELKSDDENAVERLFAFDKLLRDASASDADKAIALAWILHLGGDIHQPLHCSARVTELEPKGDQGGNLFELTPKDTPRENKVNLHWYWDSIVGRNVPRKNDASDADYLPAIANQMIKKYPLAKMQNRLKLGKFDEWQQEGFRIASTQLYPSSLKRFQMPSESYKRKAFEISQEQIVLAGYRLGEMLNQIFGSQLAQETRREIEKSNSAIGQGKNDSWLWLKTRAALAAANDLRESTINVDVVNSVVTLRGTVANSAQKTKTEQVIKGIEGVKAVKNLLKVISK